MITQQHNPSPNPIPLPHLNNPLLPKQRRPRTPQRRIRSNMDALFPAEIDDFLLREERVVFNLVGGGHDARFGEQSLEEGDGEVCYADGFCEAAGEEGF